MLSPGQWLGQWEAKLRSQETLREAMAQLDARDIHLASDVAGLQEHLLGRLRVGGEPGRLELSYQTTNREQAKGVLEALSRAAVGRQMLEDRAAGRADTLQQVRAAQVDASPVSDVRLRISTVIFAVMTAGAVGLWVGLRWWLGRRRRVLASAPAELAVLDKPEAWSPVRLKMPTLVGGSSDETRAAA